MRAGRKRAKLMQPALAEMLGIPQGYVSDMQRGKRTVGKAMAKKLSEVLNPDYHVFL